jgi:hypothetical protein
MNLFCVLVFNKKQSTTNFEHILDDQQFDSNMIIDQPYENATTDHFLSSGVLFHLMYYREFYQYQNSVFADKQNSPQETTFAHTNVLNNLTNNINISSAGSI